MGFEAGYSNTSGRNNIFIGVGAGYSNTTGNGNTFMGEEAGTTNITGDENVFVGLGTGYSNTTGTHNSFLGWGVGMQNTTGNENSAIGYKAGNYNQTGSGNAILGFEAGYGSDGNSYSNATLIGYQAGYSNTTDENTFVGASAGWANVGGYENTFLGTWAGESNTEGARNTFVGQNTGNSNQTGNSNTFIGDNAGMNVNTSSNSTIVGANAALFNSGGDNTIVGSEAGWVLSAGERNALLGMSIGHGDGAGGPNGTYSDSAVIGYKAGYYLTTGNNNNLMGSRAGYNLTTGNDNTLLGYQAGQILTIGSGNILIGSGADVPAAGSSARLNIGNAIYGDLGQTYIGIGTTNPGATLEVAGQVKITGGIPGTGKVLTSDADGLASWATASAGDVYLASSQTFTGQNNFTAGLYSTGSVGAAPFSGAGTRFMWVPSKYSIRAGSVDGTQWDSANIGDYSVAFGKNNQATGAYDTVAGGEGNAAHSPAGGHESIGGGGYNTTSGAYSTISGGGYNTTSGAYSTIGGGYANTAIGGSVAIGGGDANTATGSYNTIGGGINNMTAGIYSMVPGGGRNTALGDYSFAAGFGSSSTVAGAFTWGDSQYPVDGAVINNVSDRTWFKNRGGFLISTTTTASAAAFAVDSAGKVGIGTAAPTSTFTVVGTFKLVDGTQGAGKVLTSDAAGLASWATASGGGDVVLAATQTFSGVNTFTNGILLSSGIWSAGGNQRGLNSVDLQTNRAAAAQVASGQNSFIGGGANNTASGPDAAVSGGYGNIAVGNDSFIGSGYGNMVTGSGYRAVVPGGESNTAAGQYSFAAGKKSSSTANGAFTWSDSGNINIGVVTENNVADRTWFKNSGGFLVTGSTQPISDGGFYVSGAGKVGIGTASPGAKLDVAGGDINTSETYQLDGQTVLSVRWGQTLALGFNNGPADDNDSGPNTYVGVDAGRNNTSAGNNTYLGYRAGYTNAGSGNSNSFMGMDAGYTNTGSNNTFMGRRAGYSNGSASNNIYIGDSAGYFSSDGGLNVYIGNNAGKGPTDTLGGSQNTYVGYDAGNKNTLGSENVFMGSSAGAFNATGSQNTAVGMNAGLDNVTGSANAILGYKAGNGDSSLSSYSSSTLVGYQAGAGLSTGSDNILLGWNAGSNITTGSGNIVIGYNKTAPSATTSNHLNIGGVLFGNLAGGNIGIGAQPSLARLEVVGPAASGATENIVPAIKATGGNAPFCFMAGTEISMPAGTVGIETLKVGDRVLSYDVAAGKLVESTVATIHKRISDHHYLINNKIRVTGEHPFYVRGEWVKVKDLAVGAPMFDGRSEVPVTSIKRVEGAVEVYNFEVANYHNYFADGVLVHNKTDKTYALYAEAGTGSTSYAAYFGGKVGLGTEAPGATLHIYSTSQQVLLQVSTGTVNADALVVRGSGNVGVGTLDPVATLDINGFMRLKRNTIAPVACSPTYDGAIALTNDTYKMCVCNGATNAWLFIGTGGDCAGQWTPAP